MILIKKIAKYSNIFLHWNKVRHILVLKRISRLSSRISKVEQMAKAFLM
jgi:hypothetical protein